MNKVSRYYVRRINESGQIIVEISEILDREDYIKAVALRKDSEPFEMIQELSEEYRKAVNIFFEME